MSEDLTNAFATDGTGFKASKGYHNDKVELSWTNSVSSLTNTIKIYRKPLGSINDSTIITTLNGSSAIFPDPHATAGTLYKNTIVAEGLCDKSVIQSNVVNSVGFRTSSGEVSGKVTYDGGIAVENVKIKATSTTGITGKSLLINKSPLTITDKPNLDVTDELIIESWIKPTSYPADDFDVIDKNNSYSIYYNGPSSSYRFFINNNGSHQFLDIHKDSLAIGDWNHLAGMVTDSAFYFLLNGEVEDSLPLGSVSLVNSASNILLYTNFSGFGTEVRVWNKSKSLAKMRQDYARYVQSTEKGLRVHLPMSEGDGLYAYDRSKNIDVNSNPNENHASFGTTVQWKTDVPSLNQLSNASYTDFRGNYILDLPYRGIKESYLVEPVLPFHSFDPDSRLITVGEGSLLSNGFVDFTDISSFRVTGQLFYKDTNCFVQGAFLNIDGNGVFKNDSPVITDSKGKFDIQVPIGQHEVTLTKPGHVFDKGSLFLDFQEPIGPIEFSDSTLVKVVGRVVGGQREASKVPGLGRSKNNIGIAQLIFDSSLGCIADTVRTDSITGEYTTYLPPLLYTNEVSITDDLFDDENGPKVFSLDISNEPILKTEYDTLYDSNGVVDRIDSIKYHRQFDHVYDGNPTISVTELDGQPFIGDSTYTYEHPVTKTISKVNLRTNPFRWPVLHQGGEEHLYTCAIQVYEEYINEDNPNNTLRDSVPAVIGELAFTNQLSDIDSLGLDQESKDAMSIVRLEEINTKDSLRTLIYKFKPGYPNLSPLNTDPRKISYTKAFEIRLQKGSKGFNWGIAGTEPDKSFSPDNIFRAYILGGVVTGPQFATNGPTTPVYILRDPPGSNSYASREIGSTTSKNHSWQWNQGGATHLTDNVHIKASTLLGLFETEKNISAGVDTRISGGRRGSQKISTTNTKSWSTDSSTDQPGRGSDVYVGQSQNVEFGVTENLTLVPDSLTSKVEKLGDANKDGDADNDFIIAKTFGVSVNPTGYATTFLYPETHIINYLIPDLANLRDKIIQTRTLANGSPKYVSKLPVGHPHYGLNNDDPVFGHTDNDPKKEDDADINGDSYEFKAPSEIDSVRHYNKQINLWEEAIKRNEWEKLNINNVAAITAERQKQRDALKLRYKDAIEKYEALTIAETTAVAAAAINGLNPVPGVAAVIGFATFGVVSGTGVLRANVSQDYNKYKLASDRLEAKFTSILKQANGCNDPSPNGNTDCRNFSIAAGVTYSESITQSAASSYTESYDYSMSTELKADYSLKLKGNGFSAERGISMDFSSGRDWSNDEESTETVAFTIHDPDQSDFFSVDVYESFFGYGPIFKKKDGGQTSCPYEGKEVTQYLEPFGQELSGETRAIDAPSISVNKSIQTNIPADVAAVYNITLGNESFTNIPRIYNILTVSTSNPYGAIVRIDGQASISPSIPGRTQINKVLTVSKGAGPVYNYDSLLVIIYAPCQYAAGTSDNLDIADSTYISAHFIPQCTDVTLSKPEDQWVLNNSFNEIQPIKISNYNINNEGLNRLYVEYKPREETSWIPFPFSFWKDTSNVNIQDINPIPIPTNTISTTYDWDVSMLVDGYYDVRVVSECVDTIGAVIATKESAVRSGYIDEINPHAFGDPNPKDGILGPEDDIKIKFNELINIGSLTSRNFDVRGVLNQTDLRHQESLLFDGVNDFADFAEYNLSKRSFTIQFWAKRNSLGRQVLFSQGLNDSHQLNIGFDSGNRLRFELGNKILTSDESITDLNKWNYYTIIYDRENSNAEIIISGGTPSTSNFFTVDYTGSGRMYLGKSSSGTPFYFDGSMHELRIWSKVGILPDINKTLSGRELGIIGYWPMDEAIGLQAFDKVRGRHINLHGTSWSILPAGNAFHFYSPSDYLLVDSASTLSFSQESDMTIEFWAKAPNTGNNMTVLSNGKADGTGSQGSWDIFFNAAGELVVQNDGNELKTSIDHLDNNWHHFAIVVSRLGNMSIYVDNQLVESELATLFKEFGSTRLWVGCRGSYSNVVETRDQFFSGMLDDIRIWNLARNAEQIERDYVNALTGDEPGLQAYYSFDKVISPGGIPSLTPTLDDKSMSEYQYNLSLGVNTNSSFTNQTAPIKLARPIRKVNFSYSVNQDEIVITVDEEPARIENVTLDITVKGVQDEAGNFMEFPRTWIAYVDKNQVFWQEQYLPFEKEEGESLSFEATIENSGGAAQRYVIGNLPEWLSASPSAGVIDPNSTLKVDFSVNPLMDIGSFTQDIYVTGDFGFNEKLVVDIKNIAEPPVWEVNPNNFQYSMNITGTLRINDVISIDEDDIVSAFINDELVGVSPIEYFENQGLGLIFLTINSHNLSGDVIEFRVWDASEGRLIVDVTPNDIIFTNGDVLGNSADPVDIKAFALSKLTYALLPGWNWISFPNNGPILSDIPQLFSDLSLIEFDQFESLTEFASINSSSNWMGNLDTVVVENGYKLYVENGGSFDYEGIFEDPNTHAVQLDSNWNWVGMIAEQNLDINTALATLDPVTGDLIKSQKRFAVYDNSFGWVGNLRTLVPQEGYLIKLNGHLDELIYPSSISSVPLNTLKSTTQPALASLNESLNESFVSSILDLDEHQYSENMSMVVQIDSCHLGESYDMWYLVALSGAETRGVAEVSYDVAMDAFMAYLTVYGESNESLEFRLVKGDMSNQVLFSENETFGKNDVHGSPAAPYKFACMVTDGPCPTVRELTNIDMLIDAKQSQYRAALRLISDAIIDNERNIQFFSGREVILQSGFEVKQLSSLEVNIEDCPVED